VWIFLLRRLLAIPPLLIAISFLTYALLHFTPGDFFQRLELDPNYSQDFVMSKRASVGKVLPVAPAKRASELGTFTLHGTDYSFDGEGRLLADGKLADPRREQTAVKSFRWPAGGTHWSITESGEVYRRVGMLRGYFAWLARAVTGDLGESFNAQESVATTITERLGNTLILSLVALLISWGLAIPLGVWSGVKPNSIVDWMCGATAYAGLSLPSVFLALLAVLFAYYTGWFPVGGMRDLVAWKDMTGWERFGDVAHHLALPASVVGLRSTASYMRQMRGQMVETLSQDYVRTARAKGLSERSVIYKHTLRNAINPLVTLLGFSIAGLLSGSFLVEVVMNWPGLARLVVDSVFARDEPMVMAAVLMATLMLVFGNVIADLLLAAVDPRIRVQ
jgi:peptide/nickel transport system permease protein